MNLIPSTKTIKKSLAGHSWLGLLTGAMLYLVCLSGTLAVFYLEIERWEQPEVPEYLTYSPATIQQSYETLLQSTMAYSKHLFLRLPSSEMPRAAITSDHGSWFLAADGSLSSKVAHPLKDLLVDLHLYLHLPSGFGTVVVGILGALLCALVISGFMAHRRIFKDAFSLRLGNNQAMEQADIHNRLSVWAAPFHLMIGVTGVYLGLYLYLGGVFTQAFFEGDKQAFMATMFADEPQLSQPVLPARLDLALEHLAELQPEAEPFYISLEDVNTPRQFMIVGAKLPGRLIYAEQYRYDSQGNYLGKVGYSDGEAGRQAILSVFRLHFGHFGGFAVKLVYALLGLALSIVCVTGINIWLAKRKYRDYLNNLWPGIVWGTPLALAVTAISQFTFAYTSITLFWLTVVLAMIFAQLVNNDTRARFYLICASALCMMVSVIAYSIKFQAAAFNPLALWFNTGLLASALVLLFYVNRRFSPH
ncbi:MAG: putative iron-regulated membrane protein [Paraglaciecola sp.]|jgi:uncharacterized iron-regulated membrane protein